jgi:hypothetical protein
VLTSLSVQRPIICVWESVGAEEVAQLSKKELLSMLRFGADRIFAAAEGRPPSDEELDAIIDRSPKKPEDDVAQTAPSGEHSGTSACCIVLLCAVCASALQPQ